MKKIYCLIILIATISTSAIAQRYAVIDTKFILEQVPEYKTAQQNLNPRGIFVIGTFSEQGPKKCSGIEIKQYSETTMTERLKMFFDKINCITVDHKTPFGTLQNFVFCGFRKLEIP